MAIEHGLNIMSWHENLSKADLPPEHLWADPEGLDQWWKYIEEKRSDGRSDSSESNRLNRGDDDEADEHPDGGMAENELARFLKRD